MPSAINAIPPTVEDGGEDLQEEGWDGEEQRGEGQRPSSPQRTNHHCQLTITVTRFADCKGEKKGEKSRKGKKNYIKRRNIILLLY